MRGAAGCAGVAVGMIVGGEVWAGGIHVWKEQSMQARIHGCGVRLVDLVARVLDKILASFQGSLRTRWFWLSLSLLRDLWEFLVHHTRSSFFCVYSRPSLQRVY